MPAIPMVDLQGQYNSIKSAVDSAIHSVLDSTQFINGPAVGAFARQLADYLHVAHVIPCANGTDALQIALMALDLKPGDEVITASFTFVATAEVIALLQLKPVFVDVDPESFTLDPAQVEAAVTPKTRCIIPVHLFGQGADMEALMQIAARHNLYVVEDNAQAIGADYTFPDGRSQKLGTIGHIGCTSFFPSKNLGCYGDGGAVFTNDSNLAEKINCIANHGSRERYFHDEVGVNSRLDTIQAAILSVKLPLLDQYNQARQEAAARYNEQLKGVAGITTPKVARYSTHVYHQYTLLLDKRRDEVQQLLQAQQISSAIYYPVPLHLQKAYHYLGYQPGDLPVAESLAARVLSLPIHTELSPLVQEFIVEHLLKAYHS